MKQIANYDVAENTNKENNSEQDFVELTVPIGKAY